MIKIPKKTPNWKQIATQIEKIFTLSQNPTIQKLIDKSDLYYYPWDKVRSQPLSKDFNKEEIWSYLRLRRYMNSSNTPIKDIGSKNFTFWLTDEMQKNLHTIDQSTAGNLLLDNPHTSKAASAKYMISSLIEEAITSSQIEGAVATIKEAKKMLLEQRKPRNKSEQMIYNNYLAMNSLKKLCAKDLTEEMLLDMHISITKDTLDSKEEEGRFRTLEEKVLIRTDYGEILFVPPPADEIKDRLAALVAFANDSDSKPFIHPVVKAIILHFWLAYIHPFTDGNGRMARSLFYWYLLKHDYWLFEYTSISKIILKSTTQYAYAYLNSEHDDNDLTYFIHYNINVIMQAVNELKKHIKLESEKRRQALNEIAEHPDLNIRQTRIIQHASSNPKDLLTIKLHQKKNGISYQTARTDLLELEEKEWLKSIKKGNTFYFVPTDNLHKYFS